MRIRRVSSFFIPILLPVFLLMSRQASALEAYGLTADNRLLVFDTSTPGGAGRIFLQGLPDHTVILAITVRWADQQLYGLGSDQRLYRINRISGQTAAVNATPFAIPLQGFAFGMDIDPITDHVRVISNTGQHVRIDATTGAVIDGDPATPGTQPDTSLPPGIGAIASSASFAVTPSTTLFGIDFLGTRFVRIGGPNGAPSPNAGGVTPLGPLHQQTGPMVGIDITPHGHELFAVLTNGLTSTLFHAARVDVPWAAVGIIGDGDEPVRSLAVFSVATTLWAVRGDGTQEHLVSFSSANPSVLTSDVVIEGLTGDKIVAMQFGQFSGTLFAVSASQLYTIDLATGVATKIGGFKEVPGTVFSVEKSQADVEMDLITDTGERHRINLITGDASALPPIASGTQIVGASIGPDHGSGGLVLFGIDQAARRLVIIDETGGVSPRGGLGFSFDASGGFDVAFADFSAFAAVRDTADGAFKLVTIDLATGAALPVGTIGAGAAVRALAAGPQGEVSIALASEVAETDGAATLTLTRRGALTPTMVDVLVESEVTADLLQIPTLGADVAPVRTTVVIPAGEDAITVQIPIVNDTLEEEAEVFKVFVTNPTNRVSLPGDGFVRVFIRNDEDEGNPLPVVVIDAPTGNDETLVTAATQLAMGGRAADDEPIASVTVASDRGFSAAAPLSDEGAWAIGNVTLQPGINVITATVTDELGATATDVITIERVSKEPAADEIQYLLAEGATGAFFSTDILLLNPQSVEAPVSIEYLTSGGATQTLTLPPKSHRTIQVDSIPGLETTEVSTVVTSLDDLELGVERTMRWSGANYGAHTEHATQGAARTWFFAEGSQGFFFTFLLLANPQETANTATVRFLVEGGSPVTKIFTLAPKSRTTIGAGSIPELVNQSFGIQVTFERPGVAERAMYFGLDPLFTGGHESMGVPELSSTWVLAEGATGSFFKTFVLLANPNPVPAEVAVTYFRPSGDQIRKFKTLPANGRLTINLELEDPALAAADVSTQVLSTVPIIAERSQYWPFTPDQWQGAHNSFGLPFLDVTWALAEGRVGGPDQFQTFVLLANPLATPAEITLTFVRENAAPITRALTLAPLSRLTVTTGPGSLVPELHDESFGVIVESSHLIAVERSMYSSAGGQIFSAGTNATGTPVYIDDETADDVVASQPARRRSASPRRSP